MAFVTYAGMEASKLAAKWALGSSKAFRKDLTFFFMSGVVQVAATLDVGLLVDYITERRCLDYIK